jgi:hypothetical protein
MIFKTSREGWGPMEKAKLYNSRAEARKSKEWDSRCSVVPVILTFTSLPTAEQSDQGLRA